MPFSLLLFSRRKHSEIKRCVIFNCKPYVDLSQTKFGYFNKLSFNSFEASHFTCFVYLFKQYFNIRSGITTELFSTKLLYECIINGMLNFYEFLIYRQKYMKDFYQFFVRRVIDSDFFIEPSSSCGIYRINSVRSAYHDNISSSFKSIHSR